MFMNMFKKSGGGLVLAALILMVSIPAAAEDFAIGGERVKIGNRFSGYLDVPEKDGASTRIPYTVIHGAKKGPVLVLVAGVHAYEYPPILALYRLRDAIDPKSLKGTVLIVHIANLPSFKRRISLAGTMWSTWRRRLGWLKSFPQDSTSHLSRTPKTLSFLHCLRDGLRPGHFRFNLLHRTCLSWVPKRSLQLRHCR